MKKIFTLLLCVYSGFAFGRSIYVNKSASGLNNGSSWKNAFTEVQQALLIAKSGDSIKVAAGLYQTTNLLNNTDTSFALRRGTVMLAGYANTGADTTDAARNWITYPVVLNASTTSATTYTVTARNIDTATVIDGFFVRNANIYSNNVNGQGCFIENSSQLQFRNCIFEKTAFYALRISNSSPLFINCVLHHNDGDAVLNLSNASPSFFNCIISENKGNGINSDNASIRLVNTALVNNTGLGFFGTGTGTAIITNCIFWNNKDIFTGSEGKDIAAGNQVMVISNCITQTYYENGNGSLLTNINPRFADALHPAGADDIFFTADDGLQLTVPCSAALNAGDNTAASSLSTDILGRPRIFNSGVVDIGPYETQALPGTPRKTVYVNNDPSNTGNNDGSSWTNAYKTLQQALLYCSDTIKMAAGVYKTDNAYADSVFSIENKKVILGGYPATGSPSDALRNPTLYPTVLKNNYVASGAGNSQSPVLKSYRNDSTTVIDGIGFNAAGGYRTYPALYIGYNSRLRVINCNFIVPAGNSQTTGIQIFKAAAPFIYRSSFSTYSSDEGAPAINCMEGANPSISYCSFTGTRSLVTPIGSILIFKDCQASLDSCIFREELAKSFNTGLLNNNSNIIIRNCVFNARAGTRPIFISNSNNSNCTVSNAVFRANSIFSSVPFIYNNHSSPVFTKCLFDSAAINIVNQRFSAPVLNNCVSTMGKFMENHQSFPVLNNCTIVNVYRNLNNGNNGSEAELISNQDSSTLRANNSIFWTNRLIGDKKDINDSLYNGISPFYGISILTNCLTQRYGLNGLNGNSVGLNPRFILLSDIDGPDNTMFTADDGLRLAPCSPAVDAGSNTAGNILGADVLGNPRIVNARVDMGAYEFQGSVTGGSNLSYVNAAALGANTGASWQDAYTNLQSALCNACIDTIKIAAGTYYPAVSDRDSLFYINRPLVVLGGYPASGNPAEADRKPFENATILSGNLGNLADSADNSKSVVLVEAVKDSVVLDGLVVRDGFNSRTGSVVDLYVGGGIITYNNHTVVKNCQVFNNKGGFSGGGLSIGSNASCNVSKSLFSGNNNLNCGGGIGFRGVMLNISDCVFENNAAYFFGGAVFVNAAYATPVNIWNTVFYNNLINAASPDQDFGGAAVYMPQVKGNVTNCSFVENKTLLEKPFFGSGAGLYTKQNDKVIVNNCIFWNNRSAGLTSARGADMDWVGGTLVRNSLMQTLRNFPPPDNLYGISPQFKDSIQAAGPDGKWFTADDGLQPDFNSPAINFGSNAALNGIATDILGNARIGKDTADAGAYEYMAIPIAMAGPDTLICTGSSVQIGQPGNPAYTYSWSSNPAGFGTSQANPTVAPAVTTAYFLTVTDGIIIARDTVIVSVANSIVPSVTITVSDSMVCAGSAVVFTATAVNGGTALVWQWQVNGVPAGTNNAVFTSSNFSSGSKVKVLLTAGAGTCTVTTPVSSNSITLTVTPVAAPSVTVIASATNICQGSNVQFTATPVNGGTSPAYVWKKNGIADGTNNNVYNTTALANGDQVTVQLTSNAACVSATTATSSPITINVSGQVTPTVLISGNTLVNNGQPAAITAITTNAGTSPGYQWQDSTFSRGWENISGANASTINYTASSTGNKLRCLFSSNATCASVAVVTSNVLVFTVNPITGINNLPAAAYGVAFFPNPVINTLTINGLQATDQWQKLSIADIMGRQVQQQDIRGLSAIVLPLHKLAAGVYSILLEGKDHKRGYLKFVKL